MATASEGRVSRFLPAITGGIATFIVSLAWRAFEVSGSVLSISVLGPRSLGVAVAVAVLAGVVLAKTRLGALWGELIRQSGTATWGDIGRLGLVALQAGAVALVTYAFRIESPAFYEKIVPLAVCGFLVHHFVPRRWSLSFFLGLSVAAAVWVFGIPSAGWLFAIGGGLIAICHLPVPFIVRVMLLVAAGGLLAICRAGVLAAPWSMALWPVLGSIFMFRLVAYMYDLRHQRDAVSWTRTSSYFFMLPNLAFPLFPVIDFNTFKRTHYDRPSLLIYQQGTEWMARGVLHLLCYRLIYQYATLSPAEVVDTVSLVRYLLANFGLYLRVSGQFHLIVGILHLFGFRLPETHRFFFLASSFTDFWRRINIYWKDFMMKVVFYPVHGRVKHWGEKASIIIGTLAVFTVTWLTHSYQWFWLLGTWLFSLTDALFWAILAILLIGSSLRELRKGRVRSLGVPRLDGRAMLALGMRAAATFAAICILWSLWTAPTVRDWWAMMATATLRPVDLVAVALPLSVVGALAVLVTRARTPRPASSMPTLLLAVAPLGLAWIADTPTLAGYLSLPVRTAVRDVRTAELNRRDAQLLQRGYYERLVGVNRFNGQLWEVLSNKTQNWPTLEELGGTQSRPDVLLTELKPMVGLIYHGAPFRTNVHGMRDRAYERSRSPSSRRFAVMGASYVMGDGVGDDETFENLVEDGLNLTATGARRYELLNFAMRGYDPLAQLTLLENGRVFDFSPDVVMVVAHGTDLQIQVRLTSAVKSGRAIPQDFVRATIVAAGIDSSMTREAMERMLTPMMKPLIERIYQRIVALCRARGVVPVWVYVPTPLNKTTAAEQAYLRGIASTAGFEVIDLHDVYGGHDEHALRVAPWDRHPNALGHRLIADRLLEELRARPEVLGEVDEMAAFVPGTAVGHRADPR